jgi:hypothetical protein
MAVSAVLAHTLQAELQVGQGQPQELGRETAQRMYPGQGDPGSISLSSGGSISPAGRSRRDLGTGDIYLVERAWTFLTASSQQESKRPC